LSDGSGSLAQLLTFKEGIEDLDNLLALRLRQLFNLAEAAPQTIVTKRKRKSGRACDFAILSIRGFMVRLAV
jgi:hypothetical protein